MMASSPALVARDQPATLTVALDRSLAPGLPEIKYTLRTLLRVAGYGCRFIWADGDGLRQISYGRSPTGATLLHIPASGHDFQEAGSVEATGSRTWNGLPFLLFPAESWHDGADRRWPADAVFAAFWLLTGARESSWRRDRWDNLHAEDWVPVREGLLSQAPVSRWGRAIRDLASAHGVPPTPMPWESGGSQAAFSFTHDVDYPEIIRWIEAPRLVARRGLRGLRSALGVLRGTNHFWTFREWIDLEARYGAKPAFYFMARQGSLLQYAQGRPDDFYDVRSPRFRRLFEELRDAGCEIGLHASYLSHQSAETIRVEAERVSHASGAPVLGNRHHYWHLDPADPNETLRRHELAGLRYDSSLGLEFYPGYRRGICHPFRPYHPAERRELGVVQVPPAWMDDHFDRRLRVNRIADPDAAASAILGTARATGGIAVVDYHSRGMNADFYPRYGPWLSCWAERELDSTVAQRTPEQILAEYGEVERRLDAASSDQAEAPEATRLLSPLEVVISPVAPADCHEVAALHFELFGDPDFNGHSVATLGPEFLDRAFYRLSIDNPGLHAIVARAGGRVVGFSVYATEAQGVIGSLLRGHPVRFATAGAQAVLRRPARLAAVWTNLRYMRGEALPFLQGVPGWWVVAGVHPDARSPVFERRSGSRVAARMFDWMEAHMRRAGCGAWFGAVRPDNAAINAFLRRRGAIEAGMARTQGLDMRYYVKRMDSVPGVAPAVPAH